MVVCVLDLQILPSLDIYQSDLCSEILQEFFLGGGFYRCM